MIDESETEEKQEWFIDDEYHDFKGKTFSGCNKLLVLKELMETIYKGDIESSCHWSVELICSGHFIDLWELVLHYIGKYIHLANPKLIIYIEIKYDLFKKIIENENNVLDLRNNMIIRKLFAEIVCILCLSPTKQTIEPMKVHKEDFDNTIKFITPPHFTCFFDEIDNVYYSAMKEFSYCISEKKNILDACYWIEWVIGKKGPKRNRNHMDREFVIRIPDAYRNEGVWILWETIFYYRPHNNEFVNKVLSSLFQLFCMKYTLSSNKKRRYLLYCAVGFLLEDFPMNVSIVSDKSMVHHVTSTINEVYGEMSLKKRKLS